MTWDITGMGAVACVGDSPSGIFDSLCAGVDGLGALQAFDHDKYRARRAYEIPDRRRPGVDEPGRATRWLLASIDQALADAGHPADLADVPVLVGTTLQEQRSAELWWRHGAPLDPAALHFGTALRERYGATRTYTFANACAATLYALAMATDLIELGAADTVVAAGTDSIGESAFGTLDRVQNEPEALRPFDRSHRGMLMGEGAVAVVLTRAAGSGRRVHARLRAVGVNCDAHHSTAPDPEGITRVLRETHRRAEVAPPDIDLVMLHGSGTPKNDSTEATVLSRMFPGPGGPLMTAIKSMTGHTLGGSGLLSLITAAIALQRGQVPPVLGLVDPIEEADGLRLVRDKAATADLTLAQIDAFGFGGINAAAILEAA
ncbi:MULTISPECIES: beta-ketoacyl synthase N-terminal-like domain-containing protein [unclassified Streptomyces]|uniref:beta-ketoacyl synthase N-terminal-like domain-containing protein n=1 Tax=unclassified Streptomyces TaxID=2593676 RepID=UPI0022B5F5C3|nr:MULTISPECIES: beta-ketoacyl synthase N-terminal-like domain-containing protein [unclassified Streptomyces]MCZ7417483.1 beta-ketoacyl synthase N-terminal-like domain-containing protein [Streptomyces sp. WMMC897]MCZ7432688.1 beta-ketoacyl synthase N-terminal-like domain-containing protein [Streptomyces sp. WMMC1477]